jgi:hypothetical protein
MKWIFSLLAFILLAFSISSFTTHVFLQEAFNTFDNAKASALEKNDVIVNDAVSQFYLNLSSEQRANIEKLKTLTPEIKKQVLVPQCSAEGMQDEFFCNPQFISGELSLDEVLKQSANKQVDNFTIQTMDMFKVKLEAYEKVNLVLVGIVCGIISLLIYLLTYGFRGLQKFTGNASWLALLSAISFKIMPLIINKILTAVAVSQNAMEQKVTALVSQTLIDWLVPAMNKGFFVSLMIAIVAFVVWGILKLKREYTATTN